MTPPTIDRITFGRNACATGIQQSRPTISWRFHQVSETERNWTQQYYELCITRHFEEQLYRVESDENIDVPWPTQEPDLASRERAEVKVRVNGGEWFSQVVEAGLLQREDWMGSFITSDISPPFNLSKRPIYFRKIFHLENGRTARIYATALGVYEITVNNRRIGDHVMAPGWQSYNHRLHYQTYAVDDFVPGENTIEVVVAEGWYSGRLTWTPDCRNMWGAELGALVQVEVDEQVVAHTDTTWAWSYGPLLASELYNGETYASSAICREWRSTRALNFTKAVLVSPEAPPIRRMEELEVLRLIITPSGKRILDFGQNFVGWVRIKRLPLRSKPNEAVILRFAEVLDKGELGVRPLRSAEATDKIYLGTDELEDWEPKFTTHGFRYCEVDGLSEVDIRNFTGVVIHSDMERIGDFSCSHKLVNQLHKNVVWSLKGNFVGLPTDCPQRDERLGWTGDLQAFASTASLLYDTSGFLANWLHDLSVEQLVDNGGVVPLVVPNTMRDWGQMPQAVWGDVCAMTPNDLHIAYGSTTILYEMWESMTVWLDKGIPKGKDGLWLNPRNGFQLADWLDPRAPADDPGAAMTDQHLVADAFLVRIADIISTVARHLDRKTDEGKYREEHTRLRSAFQYKYMTPSGRLASDTQTAYTLAFQFQLFDDIHLAEAAEQLVRLTLRGQFRIATGFAGTPGVLHALTKAGHIQVAYRMLQETGVPSWLYPVTMGATTIWERWDSLLPDGTINPGEMTSFNHYALGAVASWLHTTVGGLRPLSPGYKTFLVQPRPGGTIKIASVHTITPYGRVSVSWRLEDQTLSVNIEVPPNTTAVVRLAGGEETVGSGFHVRTSEYTADRWPPDPYETAFTPRSVVDTLAS